MPAERASSPGWSRRPAGQAALPAGTQRQDHVQTLATTARFHKNTLPIATTRVHQSAYMQEMGEIPPGFEGLRGSATRRELQGPRLVKSQVSWIRMAKTITVSATPQLSASFVFKKLVNILLRSSKS